jgi:hypothetical protein
MLNNTKSNHFDFNNIDALIPQSCNYLKSYILFSCNCCFIFNFMGYCGNKKIVSKKYAFGFQLIALIFMFFNTQILFQSSHAYYLLLNFLMMIQHSTINSPRNFHKDYQ